MSRNRALAGCTLMLTFAIAGAAQAQAPTIAGELSAEPPTRLSLGFDWKIASFEGLTIRNTNVAFLAGIKNIAGSSGLTLKHSRIYNVGRAVQDDWSDSKNYYIADNVFIGRHDPDRMMSWIGQIWEKFPGFPELLTSEYAIKVYGQGHVVAHNYLAHWHDAIDVATYGDPDGGPDGTADQLPVSNVHFRNNLIVSQDALDPVFAVGTYTSYSTSDYNAFRPNPGKDDSFEWNTPPQGVLADYKTAPVGRPLPHYGPR